MNYRKICIAAFVAIAGGIVNVWGQELTLKDCSLDATPERLQPIVSEQSGDTYLMLSGDGKRVERYDYKTGKMQSVMPAGAHGTAIFFLRMKNCCYYIRMWRRFTVTLSVHHTTYMI